MNKQQLKEISKPLGLGFGITALILFIFYYGGAAVPVLITLLIVALLLHNAIKINRLDKIVKGVHAKKKEGGCCGGGGHDHGHNH